MSDHDSAEEFEVGRCKVKIKFDPDPMNPRKEYDNMGTFVCWHGKYDLGDEQPKKDPSGYLHDLATQHDASLDTDDLAYGKKRNAILNANYELMPLALYDHSGISMYEGGNVAGESAGDPRGHHMMDSAGWDSGQVGFAFISLKKALEEAPTVGEIKGWDTEVSWPEPFEGKNRTVRDFARKHLEGELETYDAYLTGQVFGYVVEDEDGNHLDSCWGFYEDDYCKKEATDMAEFHTKKIEEAEEAARVTEHETALAETMP